MSREVEVRDKILAMGGGPIDFTAPRLLALLVVELAALTDEIQRHSPLTVRHEVVEAEPAAKRLVDFNAGDVVWVKGRIRSGLAMNGSLPVEFEGLHSSPTCHLCFETEARQ